MFVAGFLFVLGGVAALALLAFLFLSDIGRAILALVALLLMLAVLAGIAVFGWLMLQGILGVREIMQWLGGAILIGMALWMIWTEVSGRIEARRRGISYAAFIAEKYPNAPKYSPPRPWGPKLPR